MLRTETLTPKDNPCFDDHERVVRFRSEDVGLDALVAVHSTRRGPALGGCRFFPYGSLEQAMTDVLRLSRGMTYKSALARLPLGGGKSVIIGDPKTLKTGVLMARFGEAIDSLGGSYVTAEDVGTHEGDMLSIATGTAHVAGLPSPEGLGESGAVSGNPSPVTAFGVYVGIKAALREKFGSPDLSGKTVALQGLGAVGFALAEYLVAAGASLVAADVNTQAADLAKKTFGEKVDIVDPRGIHAARADVFAPCALGAGLNDRTIPEIGAKVIAGAANNQLEHKRHDRAILDRGILYVPDYAINAGGIISVGYEYCARIGRNPYGYPLTRENMMAHVSRIEIALGEVFALAR